MFTGPFPVDLLHFATTGQEIEEGAALECVIDGITYVATICRDDDGSPEERDGVFWPSDDPESPGYVGPAPARPLADQRADREEVMRRYRDGEMIYCGVVVTASKGGVRLVEEFECALCRLEVNWPGYDNDYLVEAANEMLDDAREKASARLPLKIAELRACLAELEA